MQLLPVTVAGVCVCFVAALLYFNICWNSPRRSVHGNALQEPRRVFSTESKSALTQGSDAYAATMRFIEAVSVAASADEILEHLTPFAVLFDGTQSHSPGRSVESHETLMAICNAMVDERVRRPPGSPAIRIDGLRLLQKLSTHSDVRISALSERLFQAIVPLCWSK